MAAGHRTNIELLFTDVNTILKRFVSDVGRDILRDVRANKKSRKHIVVGGPRPNLKYEIDAHGDAAGMLGFDYSFRVPKGGFKPTHAKAFYFPDKPEGPVWRSRNYTRWSGRWYKGRGYFSTAIERQILSIRGVRRQQNMNDNLAAQIANEIAEMLIERLSGLGIEGIRGKTYRASYTI